MNSLVQGFSNHQQPFREHLVNGTQFDLFLAVANGWAGLLNRSALQFTLCTRGANIYSCSHLAFFVIGKS